jgi:predicted ATP-dependent endonuclease of OLD family
LIPGGKQTTAVRNLISKPNNKMNIQRFSILDFKGIESATFDAAGRNVYVVGPNAVGKSSIIDAIFTLLTNQDVPDEPIAKGKNQATISADLGEYVADLTFKRKKAGDKIKRELTVTNKNGTVIDSPRALIDSLAGKSVAFSVDKFLSLSDKVRAEYLADAIGSGNEFRLLMNEYRDIFDGRTLHKRELKEYELRFEPFNAVDCNIPIADVAELANRLATMRQSAATYQRAVNIRTESVAKTQSINSEIESLRARIATLESERESLNQRIINGDAWFQNPANQPATPESIQQLESSIADIDTMRARRDHAVAMQTIAAEIETMRSTLETDETDIKKTRQKIGSMISDKLGIDGISFDPDNGKLFVNDLPLEANQINRAELTKIGLKIAARMLKPDGIRIVRFDGSIMDRDNIGDVQNWAANEGIQLFVEIVERSGDGLKVLIGDHVFE